jgi:hypothetical protein
MMEVAVIAEKIIIFLNYLNNNAYTKKEKLNQ